MAVDEEKTKLRYQFEQGSSFDWADLMFAGWNDGAVFDYDEWQVRDMQGMLEQEAKAVQLEAVLTLPIRWAGWSLKPAKNDKGEAEAITEILTRPANSGGMSTPMELVIAQATSAVMFRKAFFEKVFTVVDDRICYDKLAWRPASTCGIKRDPKTGAFKGFQQRPIRLGLETGVKFVDIDPEYAFVHINGKHRDPIRGISNLQVPYWCWVTKQKLRWLWYTFCEVQATDRVIVTAPNETNATNAAKTIRKLKNGGVVGVPEGTTVDTINSNTQAKDVFQEAIRYLDAEMSNSVLAGFTDLTNAATNGRGSLALSKDQSDFFLQSRRAYARELAADITNFVVADLVTYNFGRDAAYPAFEFGPLSETDMEPLTNLLTGLSAPGVRVGADFLTELAVKVAGYLDLNVDVVKKSMEKAGKDAEKAAQQTATNESEMSQAKVAQIAGQVNKAEQMVKEGQQGGDPNATGAAKPTA